MIVSVTKSKQKVKFSVTLLEKKNIPVRTSSVNRFSNPYPIKLNKILSDEVQKTYIELNYQY